MSSFDELQARLGEFEPTARRAKEHWEELCVCGHLDRYHSDSVGGQYRLLPTSVRTMGGVEWTVGMAFFGCVGALPGRGWEAETPQIDREKMTNIRRVNPTCPCDLFRPVAKVDRGNRMFNQRMPRDRTDDDRHPFMVGLRALTTFLSRRKAALADPSWTKREFDRRFIWFDGKRVCGISRCKETADVWPVFVDGERSEASAVDPTDPVPDYLVTVRIEHGFAIAEVRATTDNDIAVAMEDLHRYVVDAFREFTWPRGYSIIECRWNDPETINGRVAQMTAMAQLRDRDDADWESIRQAVEQDQADLAELQFQAELDRRSGDMT